jgi:hypothetical protein
MAPKLRTRTDQVKPDSYAVFEEDKIKLHDSDDEFPSSLGSSPPVYTIDLSLPPAQRYVELVGDYKQYLHDLTELFDGVVQKILNAAWLPTWLLHFLARLFLRGLHSAEETDELRGISKAVNLPMYLLVAYNTFLDLLMGCTSGGARVQSSEHEASRMMHFRTLDWDMPELRNLVVQLDFVEKPGGKVIASSISYVGFVGILTGVKKDLSVSINFRPYHNNDDSFWANMKFRTHLVAVLLGLRPSLPSLVRDFLLPRIKQSKPENIPQTENGMTLHESQSFYRDTDILSNFPSIPTTASYLVFCTGGETILLEKDLRTATITRNSSFIAITNHDASYDTQHDDQHTEAAHVQHAKTTIPGMQDIVNESITRKACLVNKWEQWPKLTPKAEGANDSQGEIAVPFNQLKTWMQEYPTCNEKTHYVCIMDPAEGKVKWVRAYDEGDIEDQGRYH